MCVGSDMTRPGSQGTMITIAPRPSVRGPQCLGAVERAVWEIVLYCCRGGNTAASLCPAPTVEQYSSTAQCSMQQYIALQSTTLYNPPQISTLILSTASMRPHERLEDVSVNIT